MPFLQTLAGLAVVLALIAAGAWLVRRLQRLAPEQDSPLALRGALAVGPRERVVVVEVEGTWLVLGVAPGEVRALHALPKRPVPEPVPERLVEKWTS
jgi:flagellar protein FliO/FliZ